MLGYHLLIDLHGCNTDRLNDIEIAETALRDIAELLGSNVLDSASHRFTPQGITVTLIVSSSHYAFHSWPEQGAAAIDLFICTGTPDVPRIIQALKACFECSRETHTLVVRGID